VGFEPTIPVFERAKTVRALDSKASVTGFSLLLLKKEGSTYFRVLNNKYEEDYEQM
jgi:hypothetical protein